jgi:hypothetical protein
MVLFSAQLVVYASFQPAEGMPAQSSDRFAHFVTEVPDEALETTLRRARALGAGWIYVTDDAPPNPWDQLPSYFEREVQIVATLR